MKVLDIILMLASILLIGGCSSNTSQKIIATVFISPSHGQEASLFEIYDDKSIRIEVGEAGNGKIINLSSKDRKIIENLLLKISEKDEDEIIPYNDAIEVTAKVGGKTYWSLFYDDGHANKDLLALTYKLIELSPIQVGGEHNPIMAPKQK